MSDIIFLDRDGTLNPDPGYISSVSQYQFFKETLPALKKLSDRGFQFVIITNQSGLSRGLIDKINLMEINDYITQTFLENGIELLGIYYCPHHSDEQCNCRKPKTGLFHQAANDHQFSLPGTYIIGDSYKDIKAGKSLGIKTILVRTGNGKKTEKEIEKDGEFVDFIGDTLEDCTKYLLSQVKIQ